MKRIITVILAIAMVISLSACSAVQATPVPSGVNAEGRFVYAITRPGDVSSSIIDSGARDIRTAIKDNFDVKVTYVKDTAYEDSDDNYEILIGNTNRPESAQALEMLKSNRTNNANDFIVVVINDKICIQAVTDTYVKYACDWFIHNFCQSTKTWANLKTDYKFIYEAPASTIHNKVNGNDLSVYSLVLPRYSAYIYGVVAEDIIDIYNKNSYKLTILADTDAQTEYEILVGNCNRDVSNSINVEGDNFIIKAVGNKLVVKGGSDLATRAALEYLYNEINTSISTQNFFNWADGHTINGKYDATVQGAYTLNWNDEFEGSTIDLNKWGDYNNEANGDAGGSCLGGTVYWQNVYGDSKYKGSNLQDLLYTADGNLHMRAQKVTDVDFVGAQISTYWTMMYRYGIIEIRANLADVPAPVSLWLNGANVPPKERFGDQSRACMTEIDILENYGSDASYGSAIHRWWSKYNKNDIGAGSGHNGIGGNPLYTGDSTNNHTVKFTEKYGEDLTADFHIFSLYWDENCYKFALDGRKYFDYQFADNESVSVHCLMNYFIMRCRMGLATYGTTYRPGEHPLTSEALVDYVRIFQSTDLDPQMVTAWPQKQETGESKVFYPDNAIGGQY